LIKDDGAGGKKPGGTGGTGGVGDNGSTVLDQLQGTGMTDAPVLGVPAKGSKKGGAR
jgi:hypothetical protein